ncbi:MAG: N-acetyl-gamma-glutamyl-phosphate reductase [Thermoplasmata archaeon]|jgi:N-acetyl-gamma-glutamyl-phosphate/LysW-gamma-L-alpha-aminoadipyl-6-phosphate reductase|nr:N-acetyl-gamma-glutamyl-phosphate reductase [Thermoplasmata archaeon]
MKVAIVGGSGYVGGELLRLLLRHPEVEVVQVTSDSMAGKPIGRAHPNLRKVSPLLFTPHARLQPADATFIATPHGESMGRVPEILTSGGFVFDLSADFRLRDPEQFPRYYGRSHPRPDLLSTAVYGLPEFHRDAIRTASIVAVPGCIATASILALRPLVEAGFVDPEHVVVDAKSGSSASGRDSGPAGLHAERSGVMRAYAPSGHRHTAEIEQETGAHVALTCHGVEAVRGVLATVHAYVTRDVDEKELWRTYRAAYGSEPFVRIVHESDGFFREPEPKILAGTNYCDVGFAADPHAHRVVALAALDNLVKGAAGAAVQCLNLRAGFSETTGLDFLGLHPI